MSFHVKLTDAGLAIFADSVANGTQVNISDVAIGDGNGSVIAPTGDETELYNELHRHPTTGVSIHPDHSNWIVVEVIIPAESGGFTIREIGIYSFAGDLLAIASYPEQYKPELSEGFGEDLLIKVIMEVTNASEVTIVDGGSVVYATRTYVHQVLFEQLSWYFKTW